MTTPGIEYCGGVGLDMATRSRAGVVARAPAWWRQLASRGLRSAAADKYDTTRSGRAKPTPPATPRWAGWIAGVAVAGISNPTQAENDRLDVREQMTDRAIRSMAKQAGRDDGIPLRWGHRGQTLTTTRGLDMVLKARAFMGLTFTARLRDIADHRRILRAIGEQDVIGVSISFRPLKTWVVERDIGPVRIVDDAELVEVALLPPDRRLAPVYPAACAAASIGHRELCPAETRTKAEQASYAVLRRQAGIFP